MPNPIGRGKNVLCLEVMPKGCANDPSIFFAGQDGCSGNVEKIRIESHNPLPNKAAFEDPIGDVFRLVTLWFVSEGVFVEDQTELAKQLEHRDRGRVDISNIGKTQLKILPALQHNRLAWHLPHLNLTDLAGNTRNDYIYIDSIEPDENQLSLYLGGLAFLDLYRSYGTESMRVPNNIFWRKGEVIRFGKFSSRTIKSIRPFMLGEHISDISIDLESTGEGETVLLSDLTQDLIDRKLIWKKV